MLLLKPEDLASLAISIHTDQVFLLYSPFSGSGTPAPILQVAQLKSLGIILNEPLSLTPTSNQGSSPLDKSITSLGLNQTCPIPHILGSSLFRVYFNLDLLSEVCLNSRPSRLGWVSVLWAV